MNVLIVHLREELKKIKINLLPHQEIWKDIKNYEGLYQISNYGIVKSLERVIVDSYCTRIIKGKILKSTNHNGKQPYRYVSLSKNGVIEKAFMHRLVAQTFIPNPDNKPQVNHIDGNVLNNYIENLEWVTNAENTQHAYDTFLNKKNQLTVEYNNEIHSLRKWCKVLNLNYKKTWQRYKILGWSIQQCFQSEVMHNVTSKTTTTSNRCY